MDKPLQLARFPQLLRAQLKFRAEREGKKLRQLIIDLLAFALKHSKESQQ